MTQATITETTVRANGYQAAAEKAYRELGHGGYYQISDPKQHGNGMRTVVFHDKYGDLLARAYVNRAEDGGYTVRMVLAPDWEAVAAFTVPADADPRAVAGRIIGEHPDMKPYRKVIQDTVEEVQTYGCYARNEADDADGAIRGNHAAVTVVWGYEKGEEILSVAMVAKLNGRKAIERAEAMDATHPEDAPQETVAAVEDSKPEMPEVVSEIETRFGRACEIEHVPDDPQGEWHIRIGRANEPGWYATVVTDGDPKTLARDAQRDRAGWRMELDAMIMDVELDPEEPDPDSTAGEYGMNEIGWLVGAYGTIYEIASNHMSLVEIHEEAG